jgi:hypothetical protein
MEPIDVIAELTKIMDLHGGACKNEIRDLIGRLEAEAVAPPPEGQPTAAKAPPAPAKK